MRGKIEASRQLFSLDCSEDPLVCPNQLTGLRGPCTPRIHLGGTLNSAPSCSSSSPGVQMSPGMGIHWGRPMPKWHRPNSQVSGGRDKDMPRLTDDLQWMSSAPLSLPLWASSIVHALLSAVCCALPWAASREPSINPILPLMDPL